MGKLNVKLTLSEDNAKLNSHVAGGFLFEQNKPTVVLLVKCKFLIEKNKNLLHGIIETKDDWIQDVSVLMKFTTAVRSRLDV